MPKFHIGKKIKEVLAQTHMRKIDFAKSINLTRNGAYKMFEKETIDTGQLQKISKVLGHDFFSYYRQETFSKTEDKQNVYGYVTKDELDNARLEIIRILQLELNQLRSELQLSKPIYKIKHPKKKK